MRLLAVQAEADACQRRFTLGDNDSIIMILTRLFLLHKSVAAHREVSIGPATRELQSVGPSSRS